MPQRAVVLAVVGLAAVLSGCAGGGADPGAGPGGAADGSAVLAGLVVDEVVRPVGGARVEASGNGFAGNTTTGADGLFRFEGLVPGTYLVSVSKESYSPHQQAAVAEAGVAEPELLRFQLVFEPGSLPYSTLYKYEGLHECGFNFMRVCSNVNILTSIVVCQYGPCPGNVTGDRSLFFQRIEGGPSFIQAELVWEPTTEPGRALNFYIGGGNVSELQLGTASTYNGTGGPSPLMLRISNHEGEGAWCRRMSDPPCPVPDTLNQSRIGTERALLVQVDAGPTYPAGFPGCEDVGYCGAGFSAQQPFTMFATVFYGYEPPVDWLFVEDGSPPPPPA